MSRVVSETVDLFNVFFSLFKVQVSALLQLHAMSGEFVFVGKFEYGCYHVAGALFLGNIALITAYYGIYFDRRSQNFGFHMIARSQWIADDLRWFF